MLSYDKNSKKPRALNQILPWCPQALPTPRLTSSLQDHETKNSFCSKSPKWWNLGSFLFVSAASHGLWDLSSPPRD